MTRFLLAAGVAALAISAPAASKPGGNGGGHDHAKAQQYGGGGHGGQAKAEARGDRKQARAENRTAKGKAQRPDKAQVRAAERKQETHSRKAERVADTRKVEAQRIREVRNDRANALREARNARIERARDIRQDRREALRDLRNDRRIDDRVAVGYGVGGCPPGLAKKPVACMPPGQAKKLVGLRVQEARRLAAFNDVPRRLRSIYADTPDYYYRYGDGYMYRVNRTNNVVSALLPLFGLGYTAGQQFPAAYNNYALPMAYQPFYPQSPYANYRYANGYVYEVDPFTGLIRDVDPMLGYGYGFGQMMPTTYSAYNVPYQYRPYYYDTADSYYRYAPGAIYQVDPSTSLITAVAALLSPNSLAVGQRLPVGYSAYNLPYNYRPTYYDTPNDWYRYSNGNIYRVDPATQLVTALVAAALT